MRRSGVSVPTTGLGRAATTAELDAAVLELSRLCREATTPRAMHELGAKHLAGVVRLLENDHERSVGAWIVELWQICSTMNTVPENHRLFVDVGGIQTAFATLAPYDDDDDVVRAVLLTIHELSFTHGSALARDTYVEKIVELLGHSEQMHSYLSCQVLASLLHKRHLERDTDQLSKDEIMLQMTRAIDRWSTSCRPVVQMQHLNTQAEYLADKSHPVLIYLASWQLGHYTLNDEALYGYMVARDIGMEMLRAVILDTNTTYKVKTLLETVLRRCQNDGELSEYIKMKTYFRGVLEKAEMYFDKQDKCSLLKIAQRHMPYVLRYLSSTWQDDYLSSSLLSFDTGRQIADGTTSRDLDSEETESLFSASDALLNHTENADFSDEAASQSDKAPSPTSQSDGTVSLDSAAESDSASQSDDGIVFDATRPSLERHKALPDLTEDGWKICYIITWGCHYNQSFIEGGGLATAQQYLNEFPCTETTIAYILWTLYNVSHSHPQRVLCQQVVDSLTQLLRHPAQSISFFSCQILANLLNKRSGQWHDGQAGLETVMQSMMNAIEKWKIDEECDMYTEDLVLVDKDQYLSNSQFPALQYFISWQLLYYVRQDPVLYLSKMIKEADLSTLQQIINSEATDERIKATVTQIIDACNRREILSWYTKTTRALESIQNDAEAALKANDGKQLVALLKRHLTTLLAILDRDYAVTAADVVADVWRVFHLLNWTAGNHKHFVDGGCVTFAFASLQKWKRHAEVVENVLLTLYFVARTQPKSLIRTGFLDELLDLLQSPVQMTSYISCQILARILQKAPGKWPESQPTKKHITLGMEAAIDRWSLNSDMAINPDVKHVCYLRNPSEPVLQYLMAWKLRVGVQNDPAKYCTFVVRHIGLNLINDIIIDDRTQAKVRLLLMKVAECCSNREELAGYIKMQNCLQSVASIIYEMDQTKLSTMSVEAVLEFLSTSSGTSVPEELIEHSWKICHHFVRSGDPKVFALANGIQTAFSAFREHERTPAIIKHIADTLLHIADVDSGQLMNWGSLNHLLDLLLSSIQMLSYVSSRILCRILYRESRHWYLDTPSREEIVLQISTVMKGWSLDCDMQLKSRNFVIEREYLQSNQSILQHAAVWELCYYTNQDESYYITIARDIGLTLLKSVRENNDLDETMKASISNIVEYIESKGDLRVYACDKEFLRALFTEVDECLSRDDRTKLSEIGDEHMSEVLATLASPFTLSLPHDIIDDAWTLCDKLTSLPHVNHQLFVNSGGLLIAFKSLSNHAGLIRIETKILRVLHRAARKNAFAFLRVVYLERLLDLLRSTADAVAFGACRLLARILYRGSGDWDIVKPSQDDVALQMTDAINRWSMVSSVDPVCVFPDIQQDNQHLVPDYLDMEELTSYIRTAEQPVLQYFGSWQLCHLTYSNPDKYIPLVIKDVGLDRLINVIQNAQTDDNVQILLQYVVERCRQAEDILDEEEYKVDITFN